MGFREVYLHLILALSRGQGQGQGHAHCEMNTLEMVRDTAKITIGIK